MATKTWKIEKDLCRCCHAEGTFDNLAEPRTFLEKEEIYSDMLRECLDVDIPPVPGELCAITYTICNACITRLRDACNFKKQVQDCEQRFMTLYYKNAIQSINTETRVKEELEMSLEDNHSDEDVEAIVLKKEEEDDDDSLMDRDDDDDDDMSEDFPIKKPTTSMKTRPKPKAKTKPPPVKKEKPQPQTRKKAEPKPVKEKKGTVIYGDFTRVREADGTDSFTCNVCKNNYKKRTSFTQHYKHVHLKQRPKLRGCHLCDVKVPGHMRAFHMETHGLPAPSCGACGKKFAFPWQVLQHQKFYHMGEKQFRCDICNLNFEYKRQLDHHSIKHTALKPFKCDVCDKSFRWRNNLKKHMMIHLNIRPHVCKHCQEAFVQSSSLNYHVKTKHPELE